LRCQDSRKAKAPHDDTLDTLTIEVISAASRNFRKSPSTSQIADMLAQRVERPMLDRREKADT